MQEALKHGQGGIVRSCREERTRGRVVVAGIGSERAQGFPAELRQKLVLGEQPLTGHLRAGYFPFAYQYVDFLLVYPEKAGCFVDIEEDFALTIWLLL